MGSLCSTDGPSMGWYRSASFSSIFLIRTNPKISKLRNKFLDRELVWWKTVAQLVESERVIHKRASAVSSGAQLNDLASVRLPFFPSALHSPKRASGLVFSYWSGSMGPPPSSLRTRTAYGLAWTGELSRNDRPLSSGHPSCSLRAFYTLDHSESNPHRSISNRVIGVRFSGIINIRDSYAESTLRVILDLCGLARHSL